MYINTVNDIVKKTIDNNDFKLNEHHNIEIKNRELYTHPYRKHHYTVNLKDISGSIYVMNAKPITGVFENVVFTKETFFDCSKFRRVIFRNCTFEGVSIRWCKFEKCEFIGCKGYIDYARQSTWKKDCEFMDTNIEIRNIDQYIYINSVRHNKYVSLK